MESRSEQNSQQHDKSTISKHDTLRPLQQHKLTLAIEFKRSSEVVDEPKDLPDVIVIQEGLVFGASSDS